MKVFLMQDWVKLNESVFVAGLGGAVDLSTKKKKSDATSRHAVPHSNGVGGNAQQAASGNDSVESYSQIVTHLLNLILPYSS